MRSRKKLLDNFGSQKQPHSERQLWAQHKQVISIMTNKKVRIIGLNGLHTLFTRPFISGKIDHHFEGKGVFPFRRSWAKRISNQATLEYYKGIVTPLQDAGPHVLIGFSAGGRLAQRLWLHPKCKGVVLHSTPEEVCSGYCYPKTKVIVYHAHNDKLVPVNSRYMGTKFKTDTNLLYKIYESPYWLGHAFEEVEQLKKDMVEFFKIDWEDYY